MTAQTPQPPTHMFYLPLDPAGSRLDPRSLCADNVPGRITAVYADVTCPICRGIVARRVAPNRMP